MNYSKHCKIARQFIEEHKELFKSKTHGWKRTCARMLFERYPDVWNSVESARNTVRWITLAHTVGGRVCKNPILISLKEFDEHVEEWHNPYVIPDLKEIVVFADIHGPYFCRSALNAALEATKGLKNVLINGDLYDFEAFSRHLKLYGAKTFTEERDFVWKNILDPILNQFSNVYFKEGNHEAFLERYLATNAQALENTVTLETLIGFTEKGIKRIHNLQEINYGDLSIIHGHEMRTTFTPEFIAKAYIKRWQAFKNKMDIKLLLSHHHTYDYFAQRNIDGSWAYAWVTPCLRELRPSYQPFNRWSQGYIQLQNKKGIVEVLHVEL